MANVVAYASNSVEAGLFGLVARVRAQIADYRMYRATIGELQALSDRELQDLGVSRFSIREIARTSVYGN